MKKQNLLWLVLTIFIITCSSALAWNEDGTIMEYSPETDTVGAIPQNAGGAAGDTYTDRFSAFSREGGAGVSDICVYDDSGDKVIRFYSTDKYSSGNHNVYMTKKADLASAPVVISARIKGYNSQNSGASYYGQRMFPQITLRSGSASKRQPIFTMYNGVVTTGDVGGSAISGVTYENEWHNVLLKITPAGGNAVNIDYYFDGKNIVSNNFNLDNEIDASDLLITFGAHFRSGNAQCLYDDIHIYRSTEQEFTLKKTDNVSLSESIVLNFKNQLDPQSLLPQNVQITAGGESVEISEIIANDAMNSIEVKMAEAFAEKTTYSVCADGIVDIFGQSCTATAEFVTGEATLSIGDIVLECDGERVTSLRNGTLTVKTTANNQTKQEQGVTAAAALYKDGAMEKIVVTPYNALESGQSADISLDMNVEDLSDGDYTLKIFCINDVLKLGSLKKATVFTETEPDSSEYNSNPVLIKVDTGNALDEQLIMLEVLDKNKTFDMIDPANPNTAQEAIVYMGQLETDQNGMCEFSFEFPHEMGEYIYRTADEYGNIDENSFFYYTQNDIDKTIEKLNNADEADFILMMERKEVQKLLELDTSAFDTIADKTSVLKAMYREHVSDAHKHTAEQFADMFYRAVFLAEIRTTSDTAGIETLMNKYSGLIDMSKSEMYDVFTKTLSDSLRTEVYKSLVGGTFNDINDFYDKMNLYTVTKTLPKVSNWKEASAILKGTEAALKIGLNINEYNSLKDSSAVDMIMIKASLTDWNSVVTTFNNAVTECKRKEGSSVPGSSGGGGGGGSGGSAVTSTKPSLGPLSLLEGSTYPLETKKPIIESNQQENTIFDDLDSVEWAKESILYLKDKEIINGRGDGKFCPEDYITREEYITILVSALEVFDEYAVCSFDDTDKEQWYYPYVASAYENNIVDGIDESNFGIGRYITRQDAAVMSCRALDFIEVTLKETTDTATFKDEAAIADYAKEAVYGMNKAGVISGYDDETFKPAEYITRAETACVIYRILKAIDASYTIG